MSKLPSHMAPTPSALIATHHQGAIMNKGTSANFHPRRDSESLDFADAVPRSEATGSVDGSGTQADEDRFHIAYQENRAVVLGRVVFFVALLLAASGAAYLTYYFATQAEEHVFEHDFESFASEIINLVGRKADVAMGVYTGLSKQITAYVLSSGSDWSAMTVPHLTRFGLQTQVTAGTIATGFAPILRTAEERERFEAYSAANAEQDITEMLAELGVPAAEYATLTPHIYALEQNSDIGALPPPDGWPSTKEPPPWLPLVAGSPPIPDMLLGVNGNLASLPQFADAVQTLDRGRQPFFSDMYNISLIANGVLQTTEPGSNFVVPAMSNFTSTATVAGVVMATNLWSAFLSGVLGEGVGDISIVVSTSCGASFTYLMQGPRTTYVGLGDIHEPKHQHLKKSAIIKASQPYENDAHLCTYSLTIYPTDDMHATYTTSTPAVFTTIVVLVFAMTSLVFVGYDRLVQRRQAKVMTSAAKTDAIVSELFPSEFRDRLFHNRKRVRDDGQLGGTPQEGVLMGSKVTHGTDTVGSPVADLFPHTTVMFADIQGFTAWSSMREPTHVFALLEGVYSSFDRIAKRRKIFKVETVGDCYVAVAGLPTPRPDHAVVMSRFARECVVGMRRVVHRLEVTLGPGTGKLGMRFGLHSGPTTAGVLRGEKARFQLFGDTVNTAARIESTGLPNRIQLSQQTANQLMDRDKGHWVQPREDVVFAKGKGELQTYWLCDNDGVLIDGCSFAYQHSEDTSVASTNASQSQLRQLGIKDRHIQRLVDWNISFLMKLLKQVMASRSSQSTGSVHAANGKTESRLDELENTIGRSDTVLEEVVPVVELPDFALWHNYDRAHTSSADFPPGVEQQMKDFVTLVATSYRGNPFHNFEHASHVAMSVHKLLSRIVAPKRPDIIHEMGGTNHNRSSKRGAEELHDHTYGITSDPLTQFAVVLSALIHDVDHRGVSNAQLIVEDAELGDMYKNKSVAEQNSVDIAWGMLMANRFKALRRCIYTNEDEMKRFRQIIVNSVLATDIFDKELGKLRKDRWNLAFAESCCPEVSSADRTEAAHSVDRNRKATIVIEHIIQASDVAHTMQHWHVYQTWNERLFREMHEAYKQGRAAKHPAEGWYKGELWFFDNYVIPLAGKLESCGVFGVSSDECLDYAMANREEWARKGESIVAQFVEKLGTSVEDATP